MPDFAILTDTLRVFAARLLLVVLAFSILWLLRNLVVWLISKPIARLFKRAGYEDVDSTIRSITARPTSFLLLALAIDLGARILEIDENLRGFTFNLTRTLVIVAIAAIIYKLVDVFVFSRRRFFMLTGLVVDDALLPFVRTGVQLLAWAIALVIIIQRWGYDVSGLIAGLGIGGLAISLAAQETLANIFGFATIVSDRPFVVGEYVKTTDVEGVIERVGLRSTRVRQNNQAVVTVPNSKLAGSVILNWSRLARRQVDFTLNVTYNTTPDQMETLLERLREMLRARDTIDPDSVVVYFVEFGDSALRILIRCYINLAAWGDFTAEKEQILIEIMRVVERIGVQIAFPSRSLYIENFENFSSGLNLSQQPLADERESETSVDLPARSSKG